MPSSIERSAPAQNASLAEVRTTPLTLASAVVCLTISSSSLIEVSSSTFIERPGMSQVTSTMPSASVSTLKFLKAMCCSMSLFVGWVRGEAPYPTASLSAVTEVADYAEFIIGPAQEGRTRWLTRPTQLNPFDNRRRPHAAADAQRHQRGLFVGALELVEHGAEDHRAGGAQRMAERDRAAIDVDLGIVDVEGLDVAQHHRRK